MRWLSRLGTAVTALAVVTVPPLVAVWWLREHPWRPPTGEEVRAWIEQPLTAGTLAAGLAVVGAVIWALIVAAMVRDAASGVRRGWRRRHQRRFTRMRLPTATQWTAGSMTGVAALTMPAVVAAHPAPTTASDTAPAPDTGTGTGTLPGLTAADSETGQTAAAAEAGIALPGGGWIPYRTAVTLTAVASLVWLHRHYRYDTTSPWSSLHDPDPRAGPPVVDTITAAVAPDSPQEGVTPVSADVLPAGVLHLSGSGAEAAARGLLLTAVLHAHTGSGTPLRVTLRRRDLRRLLPSLNLGDGAPAGLHLPDSLDTATAASIRDTAPGAGHTVLIVAPGPSRPDLLPPATVVVIGDRPQAGGWRIAGDGTATGRTAGGRRLCVLDDRTATDLIDLIRHGGTAPPAADLPTRPPATDPGPQTPPAGAAGRARLTLLGDCRLDVAGTPVRVRRAAGLQILAYLAVHPDGATIPELIRAVWPGPPPSSIRKRLHTTLTDLRHQLRPLLDGDPILRRDDRYLLNTTIIDTDLHTLRAARAAVHALTGADQDAACHRLIDEYHGELAAGHPWPWLQPTRDGLHRDVSDAHLHLAARATDPGDAAQLLRDAAALDPHNPHLHQSAPGAPPAPPSTPDPASP